MKINNKLIVEFAGGLGAQIFSYALKLKFESLGEVVHCDTSYYKKIPSAAKIGNGISIFPWQLDYYGYQLPQQLKNSSANLQIKFNRRLKFFKNIYLDGDYHTSSLAYDALRDIDPEMFPINEKDKLEIEKILGSLSNTAVVHIRRGDYLNVASHLISDQNYIDGCNLLSQIKCKRAILVSDDPIDLYYFKNKISQDIAIEKFESKNIFLTHAIIRSADYVITANSQFSMTAALLNKDAVIITPRFWSSNPKSEHPFTKECIWLLMNRKVFS